MNDTYKASSEVSHKVGHSLFRPDLIEIYILYTQQDVHVCRCLSARVREKAAHQCLCTSVFCLSVCPFVAERSRLSVPVCTHVVCFRPLTHLYTSARVSARLPVRLNRRLWTMCLAAAAADPVTSQTVI